ncbi:hypothetical protein BS47DRAFT_1338973 [Hydnum rufescens UP504]|uniref:Uncharacterized protein n=1 Tax=Hydnum rufescens UP504 TaxID=1448309 RepID=A0A9P6B5P2_9AGAM|nr:hypothetical protein BS47DRAFT_1338973 [Hydnum rufescens UP504]
MEVPHRLNDATMRAEPNAQFSDVFVMRALIGLTIVSLGTLKPAGVNFKGSCRTIDGWRKELPIRAEFPTRIR